MSKNGKPKYSAKKKKEALSVVDAWSGDIHGASRELGIDEGLLFEWVEERAAEQARNPNTTQVSTEALTEMVQSEEIEDDGITQTDLKQEARIEQFVDEYIKHGFNATQAGLAAGMGTTPGAAAVEAHRLIKKPKTKLMIRERIRDGLSATPGEVVGTLVAQMRTNAGDIIDREDGPIAARIIDRGLGHLIKRFRSRRVVEGTGEDAQQIEYIDVELHNSQAATVQLSKIMGLEMQPGMNPADRDTINRLADAARALAERYPKANVPMELIISELEAAAQGRQPS